MAEIAITYIARALAELGQTENVGPGSYWNPQARTDNSFWVCVARSLSLSVPQLCEEVGMELPAGGASASQNAEFLRAVCKRHGVKPSVVVYGQTPAITTFKATNGTAHTFLKQGDKVFCFQHSTPGVDVSRWQVAPGARMTLSWCWVQGGSRPRGTRHIPPVNLLNKRPPNRARKPAK